MVSVPCSKLLQVSEFRENSNSKLFNIKSIIFFLPVSFKTSEKCITGLSIGITILKTALYYADNKKESIVNPRVHLHESTSAGSMERGRTYGIKVNFILRSGCRSCEKS